MDVISEVKSRTSTEVTPSGSTGKNQSHVERVGHGQEHGPEGRTFFAQHAKSRGADAFDLNGNVFSGREAAVDNFTQETGRFQQSESIRSKDQKSLQDKTTTLPIAKQITVVDQSVPSPEGSTSNQQRNNERNRHASLPVGAKRPKLGTSGTPIKEERTTSGITSKKQHPSRESQIKDSDDRRHKLLDKTASLGNVGSQLIESLFIESDSSTIEQKLGGMAAKRNLKKQ